MTGGSPGGTAVATTSLRAAATEIPLRPAGPGAPTAQAPSVPWLPGVAVVAIAWLLSPASTPWRGDLLRVGTGLAVLTVAVASPGGVLGAEVSAAGAHLLLVAAAALGRLGDGLSVPPGLLLALDALHLLWAAHATSGVGGPLPLALAVAGLCVVLRLVLVPPLPAAGTCTATATAAAAAAAPGSVALAGVSPGEPRVWARGPQGQRLQRSLAEA